jgi:hypothetical protein
MDKMSKEELMMLLAKQTKPKQPRKKTDLSDEKKLEMLERLAAMRETVKKNREAKKNAVVEDVAVKEKDIDAVFEKKYATKFDKMTELLTELNTNTAEVVKLKKEKYSKKQQQSTAEIKEDKVKLVVNNKNETDEEDLFAPSLPKVVLPPTVKNPVPAFGFPNRQIFGKGNTRF